MKLADIVSKPEPKVVFSGTVLDGQGRPINNAQVLIDDGWWAVGSARTDEQGQYSISGFPAKKYRMTVSADRFIERFYDTVTVGTNDAELHPRPTKAQFAAQFSSEGALPMNEPDEEERRKWEQSSIGGKVVVVIVTAGVVIILLLLAAIFIGFLCSVAVSAFHFFQFI